MVGQEDTMVFLVMAGGADLVDHAGKTVATENWQTFLKRYQDDPAQEGLRPVDIRKF
jgi:2,4'-dihydroxyacetophenone dioxygenase